MSELGEQLRRDHQDFVARDPGEHGLVYFIFDGVAEHMSPGKRNESVMAAQGLTANGAWAPPHLMPDRRRVRGERATGPSAAPSETISAFVQDMRARGLGDPPLVVSEGVSGVIKAIKACFPRSARQRCLAHRIRNLTAKVPEDVWPGAKARVQAAHHAPSRVIAPPLVCFACTSRFSDSSVEAFSPLIAATATFALVAVPCFRRGRLAMVSFALAASCCRSAEDPFIPSVQISGAASAC